MIYNKYLIDDIAKLNGLYDKYMAYLMRGKYYQDVYQEHNDLLARIELEYGGRVVVNDDGQYAHRRD